MPGIEVKSNYFEFQSYFDGNFKKIWCWVVFVFLQLFITKLDSILPSWKLFNFNGWFRLQIWNRFLKSIEHKIIIHDHWWHWRQMDKYFASLFASLSHKRSIKAYFTFGIHLLKPLLSFYHFVFLLHSFFLHILWGLI